MMIKSFIVAAFLGYAAIVHNNFTHPDAYYISPADAVISGAEPVVDLTSRVEVTCSPMSPGTAVIVVVGQSLSVNSVPTAYTPAQNNVDQLNIYDGKCYKAQDPLLGINVSGAPVTAKRGTWMARLADNLVAHGRFDRVIIVPMGVGATTVDQWASDSTAPYLKNKINAVALRMAQAQIPCTAIMWGQGESDTGAGTSQASYAASLHTVIAEFQRAIPACPMLIARESYYYGSTSSGVVAAQASVVNGTTVFAGEDVDSIPPAGRYDNTHLNEVGAAMRADLAETAILKALGL